MQFIISPTERQLRGIHQYKLDPAERWAYWALYNLSAQGERAGYVERCQNVAYSKSDLCYELVIDMELLERMLKKTKELGLVGEPIKGIFTINRWNEWQTTRLGERYKCTQQVTTPLITHTCSLEQVITGGCTPDCAGCAEEKRIRDGG